MLRRFLAALLSSLLAMPSCRAAAVPVAARGLEPAAASHFDAGLLAYRQGDYERTLHEMMLELERRPPHPGAREYMRLASERMIRQTVAQADQERRGLLSGYREALEQSKRRSLVWSSWLLHARFAGRKNQWALAFDDAYRVLEENPLHADAGKAAADAQLGLAHVLDQGRLRNEKDILLYRGIFFFATRQLPPAQKSLSDALRFSGMRAELDDERIRFYLSRISGLLPPPEIKPAPKAPAAPSKEPIAVSAPAAVPAAAAASAHAAAEPAKRPVRTRPPAVSRPAFVPGQWAYAQGMARFREERYPEAVEFLERAAQEAPGNSQYQDDLLRARLRLEESRKKDRREAERLYVLGLVLYGQGHAAEAVRQWRRATELDPENPYAAKALQHSEEELRQEKRP